MTVYLMKDQLIFDFSKKVHRKAICKIEFQRTLRIPDDNRAHPLPPGLGRFPVQSVDDFSKLPETWHQHGGVFIPMYQSEALWLNFAANYPFAIKVAAGKINALTGEEWNNRLSDAPKDYLVLPKQDWLDGFNVAEGHIRQFVAMPLGEGFTAEEQLTEQAEHGGLQIIVCPMKSRIYAKRSKPSSSSQEPPMMGFLPNLEMGLAPGGLMKQEVYKDDDTIEVWDQEKGLRCFVHLANSEMYEFMTDSLPPHQPFAAQDYTKAGFPWFEHYLDKEALGGSDTLGQLTSIAAKSIEKDQGPLADNDPIHPKHIKTVSIARDRKIIEPHEL